MNYMQQIKSEIYRFTNEFRSRAGVQQVSYCNKLDWMGQIHTNEMYTHRFFEHENPYCKKVETLSDRVSYCRLTEMYDMYGENLADYPAVSDTKVLLNSRGEVLDAHKQRTLFSPTELSRNIVTGWYNSPGHRANLLCPDFNYVGFGLLLYPKLFHGVKMKYLLATQNFGRRPESTGRKISNVFKKYFNI